MAAAMTGITDMALPRVVRVSFWMRVPQEPDDELRPDLFRHVRDTAEADRRRLNVPLKKVLSKSGTKNP